MSGFYLLALIIIWLFVGWIIFRFWNLRRPTTFARRIVHMVIGAFLFLIWIGGPFWEVAGKKIYWDANVRKMCAKDGGVKVYEMVELPTDQFDKWGMVKFYQPTKGEGALGQNYILRMNSKYFRKQDPSFIRYHNLIIRRTDGLLLGESILYGRGGGDLPGPWHSSSFICPSYGDAGINRLIKSVFIISKGVNK